MGAFTSAELNFLVFRYLQESGFVHTAFTLGYEAGIHKGGIDENVVPPGALITVVQKGFQYIELEANTDENDEEVEKDFALLEPLEIITKDVEELQQIVKKRKRERLQSDHDKDKGKEKECTEEHERRPGGERERERHDKEKEQEREKDRTERDWEQEKEKEKEREKQHAEHIDKVKHEEDSLAGGGPTPMDVSTTANEISSTDVTVLEGQSSEGEGTLLATGSYDGQARIWSRDGELKQTLLKHKGPIFSLKWNKKGDFLLSGSVDKTAIVWDTKSWECKQQFEFHSAPTLDVDWRNNNSFATCSTDNMIYVCKIGDPRPVKAFSGHHFGFFKHYMLLIMYSAF